MISSSAGQRYSQVLSYGASRGDVRVGNDELVEAIDSSDEWIRQRTGIITRTRASAGILAIDLAEQAAIEAIGRSGIAADDIDLVIVASIGNVRQTPSISAVLSDRVGANGAAAYDINAACAGFSYAVTQADALIRAGAARFALVIGAEKLSDMISPTDRTMSFLLGDGAGAVVIGPSETPRIGPTIWGSDGSRGEAVSTDHSLLDFRDGRSGWPTLRQDGPAVFRWAVWEMAKVGRRALEAAEVRGDELAAFVPHQANMRIIDELAKQLQLPETVIVARDVETTGNTSAASIPLATHRLLAEHPEAAGGLCLQMGFGAGLVFSAQVVRLPDGA